MSILFVLSLLVSSSVAFIGVDPMHTKKNVEASTARTKLQLVPLSKFNDEITFFSSDFEEQRCCIDSDGFFRDGGDVYELAIVEEEDLPELCRFVVSAFGADSIRLSQDLNQFEKMLISPATEFLNGYSTLVAFAEVFSGTKQRLESRIRKMDISPPTFDSRLSRQETIDIVEKDSLILALVKKDTGATKEVIASIELRLQPCDAKIPFSLPWLDRIERKLASKVGIGTDNGDLQPYLSNLCVDEKFRGKKIGRALVRCVENIADSRWGMSRMYLHVDEDNVAALSLYCSEDYNDVGHRWNPFWAGSAADIGYYVKTLRRKKDKKSEKK